MKILHLNADIYESVINSLKKMGKPNTAQVLINLRNTAEIKITDGSVPAEQLPTELRPVTHDTGGELSEPQKKAIRSMLAGGSLHSLRWNDQVYCCLCFENKGENIETFDVEILLKRGIIEGIVQTVLPVKTYVLTNFGKALKA